MMAGSDTGNGLASSLTDRPGSAASRVTSARRVGSASAAKVRSRLSVGKLTMWFTIVAPVTMSSQRILPPPAPSRATAGNCAPAPRTNGIRLLMSLDSNRLPASALAAGGTKKSNIRGGA